MSPRTFFDRIPAPLRPGKNPHKNPCNLKYILMKNRPFPARLLQSAKNRFCWAALLLAIGACLPFWALYILIFGEPEDSPNPIETAFEKWFSDRHLGGWYFDDPKNMEDSLRIDAITAMTRKENCFVSFNHPVTGKGTVIGITANGSAAAYELLKQDHDPGRQVLKFVREYPRFQNEAELIALLDAQLQTTG